MITGSKALLLSLLACVLMTSAVRADETIPSELQGIEIEERLGQQVPLDTTFVDHTGAAVTLRSFFAKGRPVILVLNYYGCPTLCSLVLNGLTTGLRGLEFTVGEQFEVVSLSIKPDEGTELAKLKREAYLTSLARPVADSGKSWAFLTGTEAQIVQVAKALGFHYRWDEGSKQYAHAAGLFVLTPDGVLSRTLYGIVFRPRDLRLALVEASKGGIGSPVDRLLLFCYHYDPKERRYAMTARMVMRIGGVLTMSFLGLFLLAAWRRERRASVNG
jgi:protein SCO1/2